MNRKTALTASFLIALSSPVLASNVLVSNSFDSDTEGWTALTTTGSTDWSVSGSGTVTFSADGSPGGALVANDPDSWWTYFVAPAPFLGNQSAAFGGSLAFDSRYVTPGSSYANEAEVVLKGAGLTLVYEATNSLPNTWTHFEVALSSGGWRVSDTFSGVVATDAQMLAVLSDVDALWINAEHFTPVQEVIALDNVTLSAPVPEPETWALMLAGLGLTGYFARKKA